MAGIGKKCDSKLLFQGVTVVGIVSGLKTGERIDEDAPLPASDPYGESKTQAEDLILSWA